MEPLDFTRCKALNNIPNKKLLEYLNYIDKTENDQKIKVIKSIAINRYAESNIPIEYWKLNMENDFKGDNRLYVKYEEYIKDIKKSYIDGESICFAGNHGIGKSFCVSCILKKASQKGYSCLYSTLENIVNVTTQGIGEDKYLSKRELNMVDFLVIDEFDNRFMSGNGIDLYARSLENIFRTRSQNKLPTLMCTNSPNIIETFNGSLKDSLNSLMKGYLTIFPVFGEDFRKK